MSEPVNNHLRPDTAPNRDPAPARSASESSPSRAAEAETASAAPTGDRVTLSAEGTARSASERSVSGPEQAREQAEAVRRQMSENPGQAHQAQAGRGDPGARVSELISSA